VQRRPLFLWIFLLVLAPIGAAVTVSALLLFGVNAHAVFAPGRAFQAFLNGFGLHAPNAVGVVSTAALWWAIFAALGLAWEWYSRRRAAAP